MLQQTNTAEVPHTRAEKSPGSRTAQWTVLLAFALVVVLGGLIMLTHPTIDPTAIVFAP